MSRDHIKSVFTLLLFALTVVISLTTVFTRLTCLNHFKHHSKRLCKTSRWTWHLKGLNFSVRHDNFRQALA